MFSNLGDVLLDRASTTSESALIAAPFIKVRALRAVLDAIAPSATVVIVTRWFPEEIVAGVSDLEVWDLVQRRIGTRLLLRPDLHAKYYRFDNQVLTGSANVSERALGWSPNSNLELLTEQARSEFVDFERHLLRACIEVDQSVVATMRSAVENLRLVTPSPAASPEPLRLSRATNWTPRSLQVQRLYDCYLGDDDSVIQSVFLDGTADLEVLDLPPNLSEADFRTMVSSRLQELPVVALIDSACGTSVDRGRGAQLLMDNDFAAEDDAQQLWDLMCAWLTHFFPLRYRMKMTFSGPELERSQILL